MSSEDIADHALNVSTSKQKYSFPKEDRFNLRQTKPICDVFYDLPSTRTRRCTSLGMGNKDIGLKKDNVVPGAGTYTFTDDFGHERNKYNIPSFGTGREQMEIGGPLGHVKLFSKLPGPGNYNCQTHRDFRAPSLKSRLPDLQFQKSLKNPGPGTYNHQKIGTQAYYISSKFRNFTNHKFSQVSRDQMSPMKRNSLGPAQYRLVDSLNPVGRYSQSKHSSVSSCVFSKSNRPGLALRHQGVVPGPGHYASFSSFS